MIRDQIYFFMLDDEKGEKEKELTKIVNMDFYVENEIINVKRLKKNENDKTRDYFYIFETSERMQIAEMNNDIYNLKQIRKIKEDDNILFKFQNKKLIYFENYLKTLQTSRKYIFTLIEFYKHIIHAIELLVNNNIVNNYINFETILVDTNEKPLLCNFKFSIDISRPDISNYIKHFFIEYNNTYLSWPPELHLLSYLLTNKLESLSIHNIEYVIQDCINNNYLLKNFGSNIINNFKESGIDYFKKYINKSYDFIVTDIIKYYNTWDNYAFSILYLQILISIHKKIKKNNKFIIIFMKLLVENININPQKRLTLKDTLNSFQKSYLSVEREHYIDLLNSL
jgi:hypothetical protein